MVIRAILAPRGHLAMSGNIASCHSWLGGGGRGEEECSSDLYGVGARDSAQLCLVHRMNWQTQSYLAPDVNSAKVDRHCISFQNSCFQTHTEEFKIVFHFLVHRNPINAL